MKTYCLRFIAFDGTHTEWSARQSDGMLVGGIVRASLTHYYAWIDASLTGEALLTRRETSFWGARRKLLALCVDVLSGNLEGSGSARRRRRQKGAHIPKRDCTPTAKRTSESHAHRLMRDDR